MNNKIEEKEEYVDKKGRMIKVATAIVIVLIIVVLMWMLIPIISYKYFNEIKFDNILKENGYTTYSNERFEKQEGNIRYTIEVIKRDNYSIPEFYFSKQIDYNPETSLICIAYIEFTDLNDENKNYIYPINTPTNITTGQKMTLSELKDQLNTTKEGYIIDYFDLTGDLDAEVENVTRDEWLKVSQDYINGVEEAYNEVINMFK